MSRPEIDPVAACLDRTRAAVLNRLIVSGLGIGLSGWTLRGRARGATLWPTDPVRQGALSVLLGLVAASYLTRRTLASRAALRDPATRAARFYRAHVLSATLGLLAVPLGFAYAFAVLPRLEAVGPFWVAAMALNVLALPRARDLEDFDLPMTPADAVEVGVESAEARQ